ncbi:MAG: methylated-DNA--[protein]-cysteine S-methyltransferase [Rhodobacteraceae bacterium]|nr:methylated-DNA--[protein]-cysteine S-methyltransferase [Paracoccaceae bacterium]
MTEGWLGVETPLGRVSVQHKDGVLRALIWGAEHCDTAAEPVLTEAAAQLRAYFAGRLQRFDLPFDWGTGLQEKVRRAMAAIPFGETLTYGDIARAVSAPAQAVGQACGANPLPILIPCHRVLGAKGLGGFSAKGGVETKVWLLRHEGAAGLLI